MTARDELESIILFRSQEGTERDRYGNLKKAAIATGALGLAGGGIYAASKIGRGVGRLAKGGEDILGRVSGVLKEVHHNATDIGQYAHTAIPKAEAYVASAAPKVEAYVKDHIIPITEKVKGVVDTMHKGLQPMRDYGAIYRGAREGALFIPKLASNPKKWWGNVKAGWSEGRHGAAPAMDAYYHDPETAAKVQPHIERWVKRIGKTKESIAKRAPAVGSSYATSAGPVMQWSARDQLESIINFDAATMIADKLGKVAWGKIGQGALKYGGMGAIGGAVIGGAQGAANGDIVGGAASGAVSGGMLGAAGGALHSAGAFKGLMGTEEQIAARAAKKAAAGKAGAAATTPAVTGVKPRTPDAAGGNWNTEAPAKNTAVADSIAASKEATNKAKAIAARLGAGAKQQYIPQTSMMTPMLSARGELDLILFKKKGGDYKRHWSQKKTIKKKGKHPEPDKEGDMDSDDKKDVKYSAREELEVIQFGRGDMISKLAGVTPYAVPQGSSFASSLAKKAKIARVADKKDKMWLKMQPSLPATSSLMPKHALAQEIGGAKFAYDIANRRPRTDWAKPTPAKLDPNMPGAIAGKFLRRLSARDQLNTILMGVDVRPRNPLGEFSGAEEGQPNPNHMKITYSGLAAGAAGGAAFQGGSTAMKALIEKLKAVKKK